MADEVVAYVSADDMAAAKKLAISNPTTPTPTGNTDFITTPQPNSGSVSASSGASAAKNIP